MVDNLVRDRLVLVLGLDDHGCEGGSLQEGRLTVGRHISLHVPGGIMVVDVLLISHKPGEDEDTKFNPDDSTEESKSIGRAEV